MSSDALRDGWISYLTPFTWDWFVTLTFRNPTHPEAADKLWRVWVSKINRTLYGPRWHKRGQGVYWVRAIEWQRRDVIHFHALMADVKDLNYTLRRWDWMQTWDQLAGFARIEPPRSADAVRRYCAKYVMKGGQIDLSGNLNSYARVAGEMLA